MKAASESVEREEVGELARQAGRLATGRYLVMGDRLSALSREVARGFSRSLQVRLTEHSVTIGQYSFLRALWIEDGITQRELSERVGLMESTTSTAVKSLEALGYVGRSKKPRNSKQIHVTLTKAGRELEKALAVVGEEINRIATDGLSQDDVETLRRCLLKMVENFADDEARWPDGEMRMISNRDLARMRSTDF